MNKEYVWVSEGYEKYLKHIKKKDSHQMFTKYLDKRCADITVQELFCQSMYEINRLHTAMVKIIEMIVILQHEVKDKQ